MVVNCVRLVQFVEFMTSDMFRRKFPEVSLEVRRFLKWVIEVDGVAARSIYKITTKKAGARSEPLEKSMFARDLDLVVKDIGTE